MKSEKATLAAQASPSENYTIFHALFEAVKNREEEAKPSLFHRLKPRK
jgi:hypothetical protein